MRHRRALGLFAAACAIVPAASLLLSPAQHCRTPKLGLSVITACAAEGDQTLVGHEDIDAMGEPTTELEVQQARVIRILKERLGLEDTLTEHKAMMAAVDVTGDGEKSLEIQREAERLNAEVAEWNKRMTWAAEAVKSRDALTARLADLKKETLAAEQKVEPLKKECAALEQQQNKERSKKSQLEASIMQCERALVMLPGELGKLNEATAAVEAQLADLLTPVDTLEAEQTALEEQQAALIQKRDELEVKLAATGTAVAAKGEQIDMLRASLSKLAAAEVEAADAIAANEKEAATLVAREEATAARIAPLLEEVAAAKEAVATAGVSMAKVEARKIKLSDELMHQESVLAALDEEHSPVRAQVKEIRLRMAGVRKERNALAEEIGDAEREIGESDELAASLYAEIEDLKREAPTLEAKRVESLAALDQALEVAERFESSALAADLDPDAAKEGIVDGVGAEIDERIATTSRQLSLTTEEVDGKIKDLAKFTDVVQGAVDTVAVQREEAQLTLEALAADQRQSTEEMKLTISRALLTMESMQGQWDEAVAANAAEMRNLRTSTQESAGKQKKELAGLRSLKDELNAKAKSIETMAERRRTLEEAEASLKQRFGQLRERRLAKQQGGDGGLGEVAEKAAVNLFKLFTKKDEKDGA